MQLSLRLSKPVGEGRAAVGRQGCRSWTHTLLLASAQHTHTHYIIRTNHNTPPSVVGFKVLTLTASSHGHKS